MEHDYEHYGHYERTIVAPRYFAIGRAVARALGVRDRMLRFLRDARRDLPVLEIGCGRGAFLAHLLQDGFRDVAGLDPSGAYEPVVDSRLIVKAYAQDYLTQLRPASLGTVVALDVIEHIGATDLRALLSVTKEKLVPGGLLLVRAPNLGSPLGLPNYFGDLTHVTALNELTVRRLAVDCGFVLVGIYDEPVPFPRTLGMLWGVLAWPLFRLVVRGALARFGVPIRVLSPNFVCLLRRPD